MLKYTPHYTVADYECWPGDWELWEGTAVAMTPSPFSGHQRVLGNIYYCLRAQLASMDCAECEVLTDLDWRVRDDTVVRPDISVCCPRVTTEFIQHAPAAIIEVLSSSTEQKDRTAKYDLYQEHGVKFYLMVHPVDKTVEAFELQERRYAMMEYTDRVLLKVTDDCQLELDVVSFF